MFSLLGLPVSEANFRHWSNLLISEYAPYFFSANLAEQLKSQIFILERGEYNQFALSQSHSDSYTPYHVSKEAAFISLLSASELAKLSVEAREAVLREQIQFGRGQVYQWKAIENFLIDTPEAEAWHIDEQFILDSVIWQKLSEDSRRQWLIQFIENEQRACLSASLSDSAWATLHTDRRFIENLLGWEMQSGANCFATSLALASGDTSIKKLWLHQKAFFRALAELGFQRHKDCDPFEPALKNAVLVWEDEEGHAQHSAYLLAEQILINKNSQCWYSPRQLIHLSDLIQDWEEDNLRLSVYSSTKGSY